MEHQSVHAEAISYRQRLGTQGLAGTSGPADIGHTDGVTNRRAEKPRS